MLKKSNDKVKLYGGEWESFARDNLDSSVRNLHFVKEAVDTFYVTGFTSEGVEWQGYDELVVANRAIKCLVHYTLNGQVCPLIIYIDRDPPLKYHRIYT